MSFAVAAQSCFSFRRYPFNFKHAPTTSRCRSLNVSLNPSHPPPSSLPELVREWIEPQQPVASREKFTIASYNILGDKNAFKHRDMYTNVPTSFMKWNRRKRVICEELIGWNPDIICLQEVDKYFDIFTVLQKAGYHSSYVRRTGDAVDGCALFWKANEFELLELESIKYKEYGLRDNAAQLAVFKTDVQG